MFVPPPNYSKPGKSHQFAMIRPLMDNLHPKRRIVEVAADHAGQRLDNYLLRELKGAPRSLIYRIVRRGEVRVNRGRAAPDYRLCAGDMIRIPPLRLSGDAPAAAPSDSQRAALQSILFEDEHLFVLDKPGGIAVHGGSGVSAGVIEILRQMRPDSGYLELVHRLDRETSGCLLLAKKRSALTRLHADLRENSGRSRRIDKRYLALLRGAWAGGAVAVDAELSGKTPRGGEKLITADPAGRYAKSVLRPRQNYVDSALVEIQLLTGRTHQARVHCAHIGRPIAGDRKYGDKQFNREMKQAGLTRLFLHASRLGFRHPATGERIQVESALPAELSEVLDRLSPCPDA